MTSPRPSVAVVEAVAAAAGRSPIELPPLYDTVDPDSIDRLCTPGSEGELTIEYFGYAVTVRDAEHVTVRELDTADEPPRVAAQVSE